MSRKIHGIARILIVLLLLAFVPAMAEQDSSGGKTESVIPSDTKPEKLPQLGETEGAMEDKATGNTAVPGKERFRAIYRAVKNAGTCLGAVGAAFCGIEYFKGGDSEAEKAVKRLIVILTAVAALNLVPLAAGFGVDLASEIRWEPPEISNIALSDRT